MHGNRAYKCTLKKIAQNIIFSGQYFDRGQSLEDASF